MDRSGELRLCSPCLDAFDYKVNLNMVPAHSITSMRDQIIAASIQ